MAEVTSAVDSLREQRDGVVWIDRMLSRAELTVALSVSDVFVCPSIYEPLGIVNLEAMSCGVAVVGTATGGIPEVVVDGVTGRLVPIEQVTDGTGTPVNPEQYVSDLARILTEVVTDPELCERYGRAGRERAEQHFTWSAIAEKTLALYQRITA
jgi:starch synthase